MRRKSLKHCCWVPPNRRDKSHRKNSKTIAKENSINTTNILLDSLPLGLPGINGIGRKRNKLNKGDPSYRGMSKK
jgi:hypothetical protein